jgi:hypothetical protein
VALRQIVCQPKGVTHLEYKADQEARTFLWEFFLFPFFNSVIGCRRQRNTKGFLTVSWNCRVVESKIAREMKFKDRIEKIALL